MTIPDLAKHPDEVSGMFDRVAAGYDRTNDILSLGAAPQWRRATRRALRITPGMRILDVACGTGTVTRVLADAGAQVTGLDFSHGMIAAARERHPHLEFIQGDATALPFADASFDATTVSFGIRNVQQPQLALREMRRVTRPGGHIVVCEFSTPVMPLMGAAYDLYLDTVMPLVVRLTSSDPAAYTYLARSIEAWPDQRTFAAWLRDAGYTDVEHRNLTGGIVALHRGTNPGAGSGTNPGARSEGAR